MKHRDPGQDARLTFKNKTPLVAEYPPTSTHRDLRKFPTQGHIGGGMVWCILSKVPLALAGCGICRGFACIWGSFLFQKKMDVVSCKKNTNVGEWTSPNKIAIGKRDTATKETTSNNTFGKLDQIIVAQVLCSPKCIEGWWKWEMHCNVWHFGQCIAIQLPPIQDWTPSPNQGIFCTGRRGWEGGLEPTPPPPH